MKNKILTLIIGILVGAIIATAGFIVYTKVNEKSNVNSGQMMMRGNEDRPQMPQDMQNGDGNFENIKKGRKQNGGNQNEQMSSVDSLANTENAEPPAMPNGEAPSGEMPTGTRPEMTNGEGGNPPELPSGATQQM